MDFIAQIQIILGGIDPFTIALVVGSIVGAAASFLLAPSIGNSGTQGSTVNVRSAKEPQDVVYGFTTKGGVLFYINGTGEDNTFLHEMISLAGHECELIGNIYFNAELVEEIANPGVIDPFGSIQFIRSQTQRDSGMAFGPLSRLNRHLGDPDQLADPDAVAENENWTDAHRARGQCYLYARLEYNPEVFTSFIPNITAEVFGKKDVFDPRDGQERWTMNPALIIADILEKYLGVVRENIDQSALIDAANVCDEMTLKKDGSAEPRYTANGTFQLDGNWEDYLTPFINSMAGAVVEWGGTYFIEAGAWSPEELTITDDDFMGGIVRQISDTDQKRANAVKGTYLSPSNFDKETEFPPIKDAIAIGEDGGMVNWLDLDLDKVNTHTQAQRLASIYLKETRSDEIFIVEVPLWIGLDVKPWDNVRLTSEMFGIDETYRVVEHRLSPASGRSPIVNVELTLKLHGPEVYDWDPATQERDIQTARTNLPGVGSKSPMAITYSIWPLLNEPDHHAADLILNWTDPADDFDMIEIEFTLEVECRVQDDGTAVAPDPPVPGPWEVVTIAETREILPGVQTANIEVLDETRTNGPYEFRNHTIVQARMRSRIDSMTFGPWITPTVA